jgi:hypothetical protein
MQTSTEIVSTTDSKEDVAKAMAMYSKDKKETKSAPQPEQVEAKEHVEASEALENEVTDAEKLESDDVDETEDQTKDETDVAKPKKKGGFQKRIDKITKEREAARLEARLLQEELIRERAAKKATEPKTEAVDTKKATTSDGRPDPEQYKTAAEYFEALTDWKVEQNEKAKEFKRKAEMAKQEQEKTLAGFREKTKEFKKSTTDFDEVLAAVDHIPLTPVMQDLIINSDNGHQILYELAKDPDVYEQVMKLSPIMAAKEMGRREARLAVKSSDEPTETKTTKAPPPIKPVTKSTAVSTKNPGEMSYQEYLDWHKKTGGRTK